MFVHGCFWHGCPSCYHQPGSNQEFWARKLAANRRRDQAAVTALEGMGYRVVTLWECELKADPSEAALRVAHLLTGRTSS